MYHPTINRVVLIGRLTRDPELHALPSGRSVCSVRIACNSRHKDPSGEYRDRPNYFSVSMFGAVAETVSRYMHKGRLIAIDGRLQWREWETPDGDKRQAVEVIADNVQFLDSRNGRGPADGSDVDEPGGDGAFAEHDGLDDDGAGELVGVGSGLDDDVAF